MAEYIPKEAAIENAIDQMRHSNSEKAMRERILNLEAADVRPVVRGKWEYISFMTVKCSNCQVTFHELGEDYFCPNCGATMGG